MELPIVWAVLWMVAVSAAATLTTMWDKNRARRREYRVPESTLWLLALAGGAAAMWTTMRTIHHKTRHRSFMIGLPLLAVVQIAAAVLFWKLGYLTAIPSGESVKKSLILLQQCAMILHIVL